MKRLLPSFVVAVACCVNAIPAGASVLRGMSLAELVSEADQIVVAKVASVSSMWDPSHRRIFSTIAIDVQDRWKGSGPDRLVIVLPGGTVGDMEMTVHGSPTFAAGERALLFLRGHERLGVVGMSLGKRLVHWDADQAAWFIESPAADDVFDIGPKGELRPATPEPRASLESIRARIRTLAAGGRRR